GGLACAVAAQQTVDLIFLEIQSDIIKGNGIFITSSDALCFDCPDTLGGGRGSHSFSSLRSITFADHRHDRIGVESNCPCFAKQRVKIVLCKLFDALVAYDSLRSGCNECSHTASLFQDASIY